MLARAGARRKSASVSRSGASSCRSRASSPHLSSDNLPFRTPALSPMQLVFLAIGLAAGLLSGVFGIGGGILIVPCLLFFAKMEPSTATGTSLGALLLPVGALGAWQFYKSGHVNVTASLCIALGLFLGAYFGARIGLSLNPVTAKRSFAIFLLLVSARIWMTA